MHFLPNGIGATLGDTLATGAPLIVSGDVWYVDSQTGTDAASPAGKNREKPLATLAQALTNAAHQDIIVCKSGHTETVSAVHTISKKVLIVGEGASGGLPTVKFTIDHASARLFNITTDHVELRNLWIEEAAQANSGEKIMVSATGTDFKMIGCYVESNDNDNGPSLYLDTGADRVTLENCTFISTSTTTTTQPFAAIQSDGALVDFHMKGCVISDGTVGWSNIHGVDLSAGAITGIRVEELSLLLGSDFAVNATWTGFLGPYTSTGGGKVSFI